MAWAKRLFAGGSTGNGQLTAVVAAVLLVLLAIEGATLLQIRALLTVHAFVGMLLIPVVSLKLASTGWRMLRYYRRSEEYVRLGPPPIMLRTVVAPVLMLSTLVLFATGTALLVLGQTEGTLVGLHKASFIVWFGAAAVHVLAHATKLPRLLRARAAGRWSPCGSRRRCRRSRSSSWRSRRCRALTNYRTARRLMSALTQTRLRASARGRRRAD